MPWDTFRLPDGHVDEAAVLSAGTTWAGDTLGLFRTEPSATPGTDVIGNLSLPTALPGYPANSQAWFVLVKVQSFYQVSPGCSDLRISHLLPQEEDNSLLPFPVDTAGSPGVWPLAL